MKKEKKMSNSYVGTLCCLFVGTGMTVAALLNLPIVLTSDVSLIGLYLPLAALGLVLYVLGALNALDEDDYLLKEYSKGSGVVILIGGIVMTLYSGVFSILGKDLSGSDFLFAEWGSFIAGSVTAAVLHYRKA